MTPAAVHAAATLAFCGAVKFLIYPERTPFYEAVEPLAVTVNPDADEESALALVVVCETPWTRVLHMLAVIKPSFPMSVSPRLKLLPVTFSDCWIEALVTVRVVVWRF